MNNINSEENVVKNQTPDVSSAEKETVDTYTMNTGAANRLNYKNEPTILLDAEDNLEMLDKPVREKVSIWKKREGAKLKDMHGIDKIKYIFSYYYQWMVVAAIIVFIICVVWFVVYRVNLNTRLSVIAINATDSKVQEYLEEVIPEYYGFGKKDRTTIDGSIILSNEIYIEASSAEQEIGESETEAVTYSLMDNMELAARMKVNTMCLAGTLDIVIAEEDIFTGYISEAGIVLDLLEFMSEDIYELVEDDLLYGINVNGEEKAVAIKMPEEFAENLSLPYEAYVSISATSKNYDEAINFIRMMYGLEYVPVLEE